MSRKTKISKEQILNIIIPILIISIIFIFWLLIIRSDMMYEEIKIMKQNPSCKELFKQELCEKQGMNLTTKVAKGIFNSYTIEICANSTHEKTIDITYNFVEQFIQRCKK